VRYPRDLELETEFPKSAHTHIRAHRRSERTTTGFYSGHQYTGSRESSEVGSGIKAKIRRQNRNLESSREPPRKRERGREKRGMGMGMGTGTGMGLGIMGIVQKRGRRNPKKIYL